MRLEPDREGDFITESGQQQQQQQTPIQRMGIALTAIRKVQNLLEMNYPNQTDAIRLQREAGDLVWGEIQRMQQQQGSQ
jgi:hypothetical protein